MIANAKQIRHNASSFICDRFLSMLPQIEEQARFAFRDERCDRRQDLITEVVDNAFVAFVRLVERGLEDIAYPTPLAQYAICQVRDGRKVGCRLNSHDVMSEYAQRRKGFRVETLDKFNQRKREWKDILVEDKHAGPADTAAARIDITDWFDALPSQKRTIAETLATGETTKNAAKRFHVTSGRISQMRRELQQDWREFQGEAAQL
jgi:hypothetical protein